MTGNLPDILLAPSLTAVSLPPPPPPGLSVPPSLIGLGIRTYMDFETSNDLSLMFSAAHIKKLTVWDALHLDMPQISPGEFELLEWSDILHDEDMLQIREMCFYIPGLEEICPILADAPIQYRFHGK